MDNGFDYAMDKAERDADIIESYGEDYDFFIAVYKRFLKPAGYKQNMQIVRSILSRDDLINRALDYAISLHEDGEIPREGYDLIYEAVEYLASPECGEVRTYWPW